MSLPEDDARPLLRRQGLLEPHQARRSVAWRFALPADAGALRLRLSFSPAQVGGVRNLLTLSLFDPHRFRGAGHRHAPLQEVRLSEGGATPGFLPGPLPAGTWTVELDCHCVLPSDAGGVEFDLEVVTLPGDNSPAVAPPPRVAAPAPAAGGEPRWLRGDLHLHTTHSDGRWTVDEVVRYARGRELDFLAVTDHNTSAATADLARAVQETGAGLIVIPGMELTTFFGHANALGVEEWIDWRVLPPEGHPVPPCGLAARTMGDAAGEVRRLGGTFVINHPRALGYPDCTGCRWEFGEESADFADVVEVWNGPWRQQNRAALALWDEWLNAGHRLPASAGSDGHVPPHHPEAIGLTHVFSRPEPRAILEAVRAGRSYLSSGPGVRLREPAPGAGLARGATALSLTVERLRQPVDLFLVADGARVLHRVVTGDADLELPLPPERARWYRAEVYRQGSDLLLAMTNPIFAG